MDATLVRVAAPRFSGTARPRPRHREAVRDGVWRAPRPVRRRRAPDDLPERPAERAEAGEADVEADVAHRPVGLPQEEHRPLDAPALEVAVRRLAEGRLERAGEVRG